MPGFVISGFCSIHFTVTLTGLKNAVIQGTSLNRGLLNRD